MTDERLILAIGRLERALSRIEARLASPSAGEAAADTAKLRALETRHATLRRSTTAAIEQLDLLIEGSRA